jgi:hypothetical protein
MAWKDTDRGKYVVKCKIGSIEFEATGLSGGFDRRIAEHEGIGRDGAETTDLGRGALKYSIKAHMKETQYMELQNLADKDTILPFTPPLFGVHQCRVKSVKFDASVGEGVEVSIEIIKEGFKPKGQSSNASPSGAASNAKAAADSVFTDLDDWLDLPGVTNSFTDAAGSLGSAWGSFDGFLDDILSGELVDINAFEASFETLGNAASGLLGGIAEVWDSVNETVEGAITAVESTLEDNIYGMIVKARDVIESEAKKYRQVWRNISTSTAVSIEELATDWLGEATEENIDLLLSHNQQLVHLGCILPGVDIAIPL